METAYFNEKLLLANGILVAPLPQNGNEPVQQSLRDYVNRIDNDKDFRDHITSFRSKIPTPAEIKYEKHPVSPRFSTVISTVVESIPPSVSL